MGVLNCSRKGCDNIMCDTYVESVGYICYECQEEFKEHLQRNDLVFNTDEQIIKELKKFMTIYKEGKQIDINNFFKERTR